VQRTYAYGHQRISQDQFISGTSTPRFYGYDGFGSVRQLTDSMGMATDAYSYDAWGNSFGSTGSTSNVYLYRGEQYDSDLMLYYLRARYFNPLSGRFLTPDPEAGRIKVPASLHKYNYAASDPINNADSSGRDYFNWRFRVAIIGPFYTAAQWIAKDEAAIRECIAAVFSAALAGIGTFQASQCWGVN
jgi:RHS repeat-associated protein